MAFQKLTRVKIVIDVLLRIKLFFYNIIIVFSFQTLSKTSPPSLCRSARQRILITTETKNPSIVDQRSETSIDTMTLLSCVIVPVDELLPLENSACDGVDGVVKEIQLQLGKDVAVRPLLRIDNGVAGLFAYYSAPSGNAPKNTLPPNIRATRLAMSCGLLSQRFWGNVVLVRSFGCVIAASLPDSVCQNLDVHDVQGACCTSPDLRSKIQQQHHITDQEIPEWLKNAAQSNYHDAASLARLAEVMTQATQQVAHDDEVDSSSQGDDNSSKVSESSNDDEELIITKNITNSSDEVVDNHFVARSSLCLHCRGPTNSLCPHCEGAYYCEEPRKCRMAGWSHVCLCATWKIYTDRRAELSTFPCFESWCHQLFLRGCQISEAPYKSFLVDTLGVSLDDDHGGNWWTTEVGGWAGGESQTAKTVDPFVRLSFIEGFAPVTDVPPERAVTPEDIDNCGSCIPIAKNACQLLLLTSWEQYYNLRGIDHSSPVALLLTFPLTLYNAIAMHGEVPVTVARMLKRPLRIHVVGVEKEMNFLDIFKELAFLLPQDLMVELTFVVRGDMLPPKCRNQQSTKGYSINLELAPNLRLLVVSGTYGGSLDPNFDCGSGPPDMVVGLNAGLFAYESWRSVVSFLHHHQGVVGVFTDYNEHSGMNCASLGGSKARESLSINPFRQPLSLPVFCMNLPQMSNGFMYVFNEQELDM